MLVGGQATFEYKMRSFHLGISVINANDVHSLILSFVGLGWFLYRRGVGFVAGAMAEDSAETLLAGFLAGDTGFVVLEFALRVAEKVVFVVGHMDSFLT